MKTTKNILLLVITLIALPASSLTTWATLLRLDCGTAVDPDTLKITKPMVVFLSDDFNDIGIENSSLTMGEREVTISRLELARGENTILSVTHKLGSQGGRTIGTNYTFNLNQCSEENLASLQIRILGGIGGNRITNLACVCSVD
jgi:hypothetical protein